MASLADQYHYAPVIIAGANQNTDGANAETVPITAANEPRFVAAVAAFAARHHPAYLGIGNEVNRLYGTSPAAYTTFKRWFADAAKVVKQRSPQTKVFTTFQYEQLNGLYGGLFGGTNDPAASHWQLLQDFPAADLLAFTSYPYLIYHQPADIPADYYSRLVSHTAKPVAFTEIGWPSGSEAAGYASTPANQATFISTFANRINGLHPVFVIWPFAYDQHLAAPFSTVSLYGADGSAKPARAAWRSAAF